MNELEQSRFPPTSVALVTARVDHGRWIADCPRRPLCPGAVRVDDESLLEAGGAFLCKLCGLGPLVVVFPDDRAMIEELLLMRPLAATRNWRPGETVASLQAENSEHGVA